MGTVIDDESVNTNEEEEGELFYVNAKNYWSKVPATVDGVLGGYGFISKCDLEGSETFLQSLLVAKDGPEGDRALDCGAGIGRITKHLLMKYFKTVDLVEQNQDFINKVHKYIGPSQKLGNLYCVGLQSFVPDQKYDVIWCQWVLGHLTDEHLVKFLKVCQTCLTEKGIIIVKENISSSGNTEQDLTDSSVTRGLSTFFKIFEKSGLIIEKTERQTNFPKGIYPVRMFALRPPKMAV